MKMTGIYPLIHENSTYSISVSGGHTLYVEESGNPDGIPVLFLHGGPGGGSSSIHRCFYDPELYRIILFDQRGCGKSTPHVSLEENTTQDLIGDIEAIRKHLAIEKWVVTGGSWGTTLALLYALEHTDKVLGLILRGIFLAREEDADWLYGYKGGAAQVFPEFYKEFVAPLNKEERQLPTPQLIAKYYQLMTGNDEFKRLKAAKAWALWEGRIASLNTPSNASEQLDETHIAMSLGILECHYFHNKFYISENEIINKSKKLADIPGYIIHGRYDMVCKLENAHQLAKHWPMGELQIAPASGHSATEPKIASALCRASDAMARFIKNKKD